MSATVYIPGDAAALALGADDVAAAVAVNAAKSGTKIHIVRNGSRGLFWLEPLVRSRLRKVASPMARSLPTMCPACSLPVLPRAANMRCAWAISRPFLIWRNSNASPCAASV